MKAIWKSEILSRFFAICKDGGFVIMASACFWATGTWALPRLFKNRKGVRMPFG